MVRDPRQAYVAPEAARSRTQEASLIRRPNITYVVALGCVVIPVAAGVVRGPAWDSQLAEALPGDAEQEGFATSSTCQACHPAEHHTWQNSYHRTMTQAVTPATVLAPLDGSVLSNRGFEWRFERRGDEVWVAMPDPVWFDQPAWLMQVVDDSWPDAPPQIEARVVMSTGSHHIQTYWVRRSSVEGSPLSPDDGALIQVPWVWLVEEGRWAPNQDSFLGPPSTSLESVPRWNDNCSQCHSVGTVPGVEPGAARYDTRTVELGIACEACHGPAERHVQFYRSPVRRYLRYLGVAIGDDASDTTIVNPSKLDPRRSMEVCGQCHSFGQWKDQEAYIRTGVPFFPGDGLSATRRVFAYAVNPSEPLLREMLEADPLALESRFWPDGTNRVAGREYNAIRSSTHYTESDLTCLSCHSLHGYESRDTQLAPGAAGNTACVGCHTDYQASEHSRHRTDSSGSECMNCHMPHTTYGLFSAMRSHRIDSPSLKGALEGGRPNACNLCHLDRTLTWTARYLDEWFGQSPVELDVDQQAIAAGVLWVLKGDAAQRAIVGWHLGWDAAREASGETWMAPYLAQLLMDPYAAPRQVAYQSLRTLPGFESIRFDYVDSTEVRRRQADEVMRRWIPARGGAGNPLLIDVDGRIDTDEWLRLLTERDVTPLTIRE